MKRDAEPLIVARDIGACYGTKAGLSGVSLHLHAGEVLAILGPNGSGKTTLFRLLLGLLASDARSGTLAVLGERPGLPGNLARIGATIEIPSLYDHLSAFENLEVTALLKAGRPQRTSRATLLALLAEVGLAETGATPVATFSLGMRQRLAIAEALLGEPRLLILDEPTNGLDPEGIRWFRQWIMRAVKTRGLGVVLSSHILGEVALVADRLLVLKEGRERFSGTVAELRGPFEMRVETRDLTRAAGCLREHGFAVDREVDHLRVGAPRERAPEVARVLVAAGEEIVHLAAAGPESDLEARYLAILGAA